MYVQTTEFSQLDFSITSKSVPVSGFNTALSQQSQFVSKEISFEYEEVRTGQMHGSGLLKDLNPVQQELIDHAALMKKIDAADKPAQFYNLISEMKQKVLNSIHEMLGVGKNENNRLDDLVNASAALVGRPSLVTPRDSKGIQDVWSGVSNKFSVNQVQSFELSIQLIEIEQNVVESPSAGFAILDPCHCNYRAALDGSMIEDWLALLDKIDQRLNTISDMYQGQSDTIDRGIDGTRNLVEVFRGGLNESTRVEV
ncbi:MAG: hypothetical protein OCC49_08435 [Fibrobacterales bacterium]